MEIVWGRKQPEIMDYGYVTEETVNEYSGGNSEGATPVPISNTEVKSLSADGTAWVTVWESRTLPGYNEAPKRKFRGFSLFVPKFYTLHHDSIRLVLLRSSGW
jgi:hypothetical protein